jgi:pimeloyl-ACP methyl ester carboxylesterase
LAGSGYHIVAPDQRGYGRTTGWDKDDLDSFRMLNLVTDLVALVLALGYRSVECVIGHDFGSLVAGYCALIRPDMFRSVVLMSAPFPGAPSFPPRGETGVSSQVPSLGALAEQLLALDPPRIHYQQYLSPPSFKADHDMLHAPQGLSSFLRAFYHMKSADWAPNDPYPLSSWSAKELVKMPEYYIMRADKTMPETVLPHLPSAASPCTWLTDTELTVYVTEFAWKFF